ncbi:MAG: tRNA (adenosine(37)-N6)-threonylcarbamoyltransferase complex dimerization subunit type 1 TsaB [Cryomorphaceae bacterium]|nr:tRNA (adenosine(37)-N6)-threonylcarbamoyltransferase complex dimerization subunit type 1 TsaB [Cryomorphaceae bacterium]
MSTKDVFWLAIETATRNCSVAVFHNDQCLAVAEEQDEEKYIHAERLHSLVEAALNKANKTFQELQAILVGDGPGSYTGLRIGVSAAKGYAYALSIPLYAVSPLDALYDYWKANGKDEDICITVIDARRMEAFSKTFKKEGTPSNIKAIIFDQDTFKKETKRLAIVGDAASKLKGLYNNQVVLYQQYPSAAWYGRLGWTFIKKGDCVDLAYYAPNYGKSFVPGKPSK